MTAATDTRYVDIKGVMAITGMTRDEILLELHLKRFPQYSKGFWPRRWNRASIDLYMHGRTPNKG